jgi:hypothetical protein
VTNLTPSGRGLAAAWSSPPGGVAVEEEEEDEDEDEDEDDEEGVEEPEEVSMVALVVAAFVIATTGKVGWLLSAS